VALSERLRPWCAKHPDVPVEEHCTRGRAAQELVRAAASAALLVVGRHEHRPALRPAVGPVTHAVIHHATCPVAVVPHG
jgi:nucleotide-binding universal stress UspA family protein